MAGHADEAPRCRARAQAVFASSSSRPRFQRRRRWRRPAHGGFPLATSSPVRLCNWIRSMVSAAAQPREPRQFQLPAARARRSAVRALVLVARKKRSRCCSIQAPIRWAALVRVAAAVAVRGVEVVDAVTALKQETRGRRPLRLPVRVGVASAHSPCCRLQFGLKAATKPPNRAQHQRGKHSALAQHQEPGVVRDQMQALEHLLATLW